MVVIVQNDLSSITITWVVRYWDLCSQWLFGIGIVYRSEQPTSVQWFVVYWSGLSELVYYLSIILLKYSEENFIWHVKVFKTIFVQFVKKYLATRTFRPMF